ncbi:ATP-binding protein [Streptomyces sp. CA-253872]|uniref:ATP-binding protein n=1 Tax=Streptomyces sp. CA-253872 TaxID=3240067 RepID=UPI003D94F177
MGRGAEGHRWRGCCRTGTRLRVLPVQREVGRGLPVRDEGGGEFRPAEISAPEARNTVKRLLHRWGWEGGLDAALLITTELVANAVRHTSTGGEQRRPLVLRMEVGADDGLLVEVRDGSRDFAPAPRTHPESESGRGLLLIRGLGAVLTWSALPDGGGKCVAAHLARSTDHE